MVMALALFYLDGQLTLCIGYESGLAVVVQLVDDEGTWKDLYNAKPHSQPILSLDVDTDGRFFLTSGADALVAKHPLPGRSVSSPAVGESAAPAAPAATTPAVHEPASSNPPSASRTPGQTQSLLSAALASSSPPSGPDLTRPPSTQAPTEVIENAPLKVVNTKHAGQQGLRIRRFTSTGNSARATAIFATAGWDGRARVYSTRTLRELAVLAWHRTGCFAVAFADVDDEDGGDGDEKQGRTADEGVRMDAPANSSRQTAVVPRPRLVDVTVRERRLRAAESTHWLAVGGKDGKVTLWDVY